MSPSEDLRVVHVVPALFGAHDGIVGGAERYALELARSMADVTPTSLVTFGTAHREESIDALRIQVIGDPWPVRGQRTNPFAPELFAPLSHADIVHCHQQHVVASTAAALFGRLARKRVFVTDLGGGGWDLSAYVSTDALYSGHLHISEYSRTVFQHVGDSRARVILGGVDSDTFSPDTSVQREPLVLFVGRLLPHKGIDYLVQGLPDGLRLEIIGRADDPVYVEHLVALSDGLPVRFRHTCSDRDIVDAYRRALCVVLPSVYRTAAGHETKIPELLGQTLLEGMSCEAPAVCTAVASLPEVVQDGKTGFVVPPNNPAALREKLAWLRDHSEESSALGAAGRRRVLDTFTWRAVVDRCLDAYRDIRGASAA